MSDPRKALPSVSPSSIESLLSSINLPPTTKISPLTSRAEYHTIYVLTFAQGPDLILRIAGPHFPQIKTLNEIAVLSWVRDNTTIPIPTVVHFDASTDNPLGCEYILQERLQGQSLDHVWASLDAEARKGVYEFMADVLRQLQALEHEWTHIGSLNSTREVLDERFFPPSEITSLEFPPDETYASLNPLGPYSSYVSFSIARTESYAQCIRIHESLAFMRPHLPLLTAFTQVLQSKAEKLNAGARLTLAHRDLHMGNIMYDTSSNRITGILDWEFSCVMPLQQGDLSRAFMHDLATFGTQGAKMKKVTMEAVGKAGKEKYGVDIVKDSKYSSKEQEEMQKVVDLLRAIVEVSPRGQREKEKLNWKNECVGIMKRWTTAKT